MTAKRIRRLLLPMAGPLPARTVRRYVAGLRTATTRKEPSCTAACCPARRWRSTSASRGSDRRRAVQGQVRGDAAVLQRVLRQGVPVERLESLLDGISRRSATSACGPPSCSTTLLATPRWRSDVLAGRDRVQTEALRRSGAGIRSGRSSARRPRDLEKRLDLSSHQAADELPRYAASSSAGVMRVPEQLPCFLLSIVPRCPLPAPRRALFAWPVRSSAHGRSPRTTSSCPSPELSRTSLRGVHFTAA